jgi:hypothetical protein
MWAGDVLTWAKADLGRGDKAGWLDGSTFDHRSPTSLDTPIAVYTQGSTG